MVHLCKQLFFSFGDVFEYPNMISKTRIFFEFDEKEHSQNEQDSF